MIPRSTYRPQGAACRVVAGRHAEVSSFCLRSPYGVMLQATADSASSPKSLWIAEREHSLLLL